MKKTSVYLILILATILINSQNLQNDFVFLDDSSNVYENPFFHPVSEKTFSRFWSQSYYGFYAPFTYSAWALQIVVARAFHGEDFASSTIVNPQFFHFINIIFHFLCC